MLLLMAAGVAVSEAAVLVSSWAAWVAPELSGKAVQPVPHVRNLGDNTGAYG